MSQRRPASANSAGTGASRNNSFRTSFLLATDDDDDEEKKNPEDLNDPAERIDDQVAQRARSLLASSEIEAEIVAELRHNEWHATKRLDGNIDLSNHSTAHGRFPLHFLSKLDDVQFGAHSSSFLVESPAGSGVANDNVKRVKTATANYIRRRFGIDLPSDELTLAGGYEAVLDMCAYVLFSPGDVVLCPSPFSIRLLQSFEERCQVELRPVPLKNLYDARLDVNAFQAAYEKAFNKNKSVRGVFVQRVCRSTGVHFRADDLTAVSRWAHRNDLWLIIDEPAPDYDHDGNTVDVSYDRRCLRIWTPDEDLGLPGLQFAAIQSAAPSVCKALRRLAIVQPCAPLAQAYALRLLEDHDKVDRILTEKSQRLANEREFLLSHLDKMGIPYVRPASGHFVFVDLRACIRHENVGLRDERRLWRTLWHAGVYVNPGSLLGTAQAGWFQLSAAVHRPVMQEGLKRLEKVVGPRMQRLALSQLFQDDMDRAEESAVDLASTYDLSPFEVLFAEIERRATSTLNFKVPKIRISPVLAIEENEPAEEDLLMSDDEGTEYESFKLENWSKSAEIDKNPTEKSLQEIGLISQDSEITVPNKEDDGQDESFLSTENSIYMLSRATALETIVRVADKGRLLHDNEHIDLSLYGGQESATPPIGIAHSELPKPIENVMETGGSDETYHRNSDEEDQLKVYNNKKSDSDPAESQIKRTTERPASGQSFIITSVEYSNRKPEKSNSDDDYCITEYHTSKSITDDYCSLESYPEAEEPLAAAPSPTSDDLLRVVFRPFDTASHHRVSADTSDLSAGVGSCDDRDDIRDEILRRVFAICPPPERWDELEDPFGELFDTGAYAQPSAGKKLTLEKYDKLTRLERRLLLASRIRWADAQAAARRRQLEHGANRMDAISEATSDGSFNLSHGSDTTNYENEEQHNIRATDQINRRDEQGGTDCETLQPDNEFNAAEFQHSDDQATVTVIEQPPGKNEISERDQDNQNTTEPFVKSSLTYPTDGQEEGKLSVDTNLQGYKESQNYTIILERPVNVDLGIDTVKPDSSESDDLDLSSDPIKKHLTKFSEPVLMVCPRLKPPSIPSSDSLSESDGKDKHENALSKDCDLSGSEVDNKDEGKLKKLNSFDEIVKKNRNKSDLRPDHVQLDEGSIYSASTPSQLSLRDFEFIERLVVGHDNDILSRVFRPFDDAPSSSQNRSERSDLMMMPSSPETIGTTHNASKEDLEIRASRPTLDEQIHEQTSRHDIVLKRSDVYKRETRPSFDNSNQDYFVELVRRSEEDVKRLQRDAARKPALAEFDRWTPKEREDDDLTDKRLELDKELKFQLHSVTGQEQTLKFDDYSKHESPTKRMNSNVSLSDNDGNCSSSANDYSNVQVSDRKASENQKVDKSNTVGSHYSIFIELPQGGTNGNTEDRFGDYYLGDRPLGTSTLRRHDDKDYSSRLPLQLDNYSRQIESVQDDDLYADNYGKRAPCKEIKQLECGNWMEDDSFDELTLPLRTDSSSRTSPKLALDDSGVFVENQQGSLSIEFSLLVPVQDSDTILTPVRTRTGANFIRRLYLDNDDDENSYSNASHDNRPHRYSNQHVHEIYGNRATMHSTKTTINAKVAKGSSEKSPPRYSLTFLLQNFRDGIVDLTEFCYSYKDSNNTVRYVGSNAHRSAVLEWQPLADIGDEEPPWVSNGNSTTKATVIETAIDDSKTIEKWTAEEQGTTQKQTYNEGTATGKHETGVDRTTVIQENTKKESHTDITSQGKAVEKTKATELNVEPAAFNLNKKSTSSAIYETIQLYNTSVRIRLNSLGSLNARPDVIENISETIDSQNTNENLLNFHSAHVNPILSAKDPEQLQKSFAIEKSTEEVKGNVELSFHNDQIAARRQTARQHVLPLRATENVRLTVLTIVTPADRRSSDTIQDLTQNYSKQGAENNELLVGKQIDGDFNCKIINNDNVYDSEVPYYSCIIPLRNDKVTANYSDNKNSINNLIAVDKRFNTVAKRFNTIAEAKRHQVHRHLIMTRAGRKLSRRRTGQAGNVRAIGSVVLEHKNVTKIDDIGGHYECFSAKHPISDSAMKPSNDLQYDRTMHNTAGLSENFPNRLRPSNGEENTLKTSTNPDRQVDPDNNCRREHDNENIYTVLEHDYRYPKNFDKVQLSGDHLFGNDPSDTNQHSKSNGRGPGYIIERIASSTADISQLGYLSDTDIDSKTSRLCPNYGRNGRNCSDYGITDLSQFDYNISDAVDRQNTMSTDHLRDFGVQTGRSGAEALYCRLRVHKVRQKKSPRVGADSSPYFSGHHKHRFLVCRNPRHTAPRDHCDPRRLYVVRPVSVAGDKPAFDRRWLVTAVHHTAVSQTTLDG